MTTRLRIFSIAAALLGSAHALQAQQPAPVTPVSRIDLLKQVLPPGDFRNVQASVVEFAPGAAAMSHRHDVAVVVYVIEGEVENQLGKGALERRKAGESWWEPPGTEHIVARNVSLTARARLLVVYIGEDGKATTTLLK